MRTNLLRQFPKPGMGFTHDQLDQWLTSGTAPIAVMNALTSGNPAGLNGAMGFTVDVFEQIVAAFRDVKLPAIRWPDTIPQASVDTTINPGAKLASYRVRDRRGKGAFRAAIGKNIPTVGITINKVPVPLEAAAVMAHVDREDLRAVAFGFEGMNLLTDYGVVMREAVDRHIEDVVFFGFSGLGFAGYIDYALTPATTAGTKAAGGTTWAVATGDEIVKDVQTNIGAVFANSQEIWLPDTVEIPTAQWVQISTQRMGGASGATGENVTVLTYLTTNNPYTAKTGRPLTIKSLPYLDGAGFGPSDRMIISCSDPETHWLPMSMMPEMLPPQERGLGTDLYCEYKFGSYHRPYPTSAIYVDGI